MSDRKFLEWSKKNPYGSRSEFEEEQEEDKAEQERIAEIDVNMETLKKELTALQGEIIESAEVTDDSRIYYEYEMYEAPTVTLKFKSGKTLEVNIDV